MQCWNVVLVDEVLCSLTLLSRHLLDSPIQEELQLIMAGPLINHSLAQLCCDFALRVH